MNEIEFNKLIEERWRRKLSPDEELALQDFLKTHVELRARWEAETALNQMLAALPDAPVASNFTSQVLQMIERDEISAQRASRFVFWPNRWLPRIAIAGVLVGAAIFSVEQYHERVLAAQEMAAISSASTVPQEWLQDFDAINRLSQPPVDEQLLAALE
jgi:hypothetical protein